MNKEENWMWCWIDHLTSSEHWEQQESTVSPLDRTGLNIEGEVLLRKRSVPVSLRLGVAIAIMAVVLMMFMAIMVVVLMMLMAIMVVALAIR